MKNVINSGLCVFLVFTFSLLEAKNSNLIHENIKYDLDSNISILSKIDSLQEAFFIFDRNYIQIHCKNKLQSRFSKKNYIESYSTFHKKIKLNNDEAVENFNKMYIPVSDKKELISLKARSINPDGSITIFNIGNLKFVENYEDYGSVFFFAFEGIQIGSEIEYIYTTYKDKSSLQGTLHTQNEYVKKEYSFELIFPKHLPFKVKTYNFSPNIIKEDLPKKTVSLKIKSNNLSPFIYEKYSLRNALKQRIEYSLEYKKVLLNKIYFNTFDNAIRVNYAFFYKPSEVYKVKLQENLALRHFIKQMNLDDIYDEKTKVQFIENYIKTKINIKENNKQLLIHDITRDMSASEYGAIRLYVNILVHLDINHQMVLTNSRYTKKIDPDFESFSFLQEEIVYFPKFKAFVDIRNINLRFGEIPADLLYTEGIFFNQSQFIINSKTDYEIKKLNSIGSNINGEIKIDYRLRKIDDINNNLNGETSVFNIKINNEFDSCILNIHKELYGYYASRSRYKIEYYNDEQKTKLYKYIIGDIGESFEIINISAKNTLMKGSMEDYPLIIDAEILNNNIIEKAGSKSLVKIGVVIGSQIELYQDRNRKYDVERQYKETLNRVINFTIPDGYKITNLEDLNMDFFRMVDGERTMEFTCKYELKGNVLTITVNEFYDEIRVPVKDFEEFRTVINAAADFNKKVLILEKL